MVELIATLQPSSGATPSIGSDTVTGWATVGQACGEGEDKEELRQRSRGDKPLRI